MLHYYYHCYRENKLNMLSVNFLQIGSDFIQVAFAVAYEWCINIFFYLLNQFLSCLISGIQECSMLGFVLIVSHFKLLVGLILASS